MRSAVVPFDDRQRLAQGLARDQIGEDGGRRLTDRAPLAVVRNVPHDAVLELHPQRHLVTARRIDVMHLGAERLNVLDLNVALAQRATR